MKELMMTPTAEQRRLVSSLKEAFLKHQYEREDYRKIEEVYKLMGKDPSQFMSDWGYKGHSSEEDLIQSILSTVDEYCEHFIEKSGG